MKRYQNCNRLVKLWRHRHYIPIPFKWLYRQYLKPFLIYDDDDGSIDPLQGKLLWATLISSAHIKMKWYYTMEEVLERYKIKKTESS
jgi:hypothetical protein